MDVEDLILISRFSKLVICKSRLNVFNVVGGRKSIKMYSKFYFSIFWGESFVGFFCGEFVCWDKC